jgi:hypothetical protein
MANYEAVDRLMALRSLRRLRSSSRRNLRRPRKNR